MRLAEKPAKARSDTLHPRSGAQPRRNASAQSSDAVGAIADLTAAIRPDHREIPAEHDPGDRARELEHDA
ncbi:MAG: hypothetical protein ABW186_00430, partial [Rhodanobacteraceae bacterium]